MPQPGPRTIGAPFVACRVPMPLPSPPALSPSRGLWLTLLLVLALKALAWGLDPNARVFLGDSASYLHTAATGWIPPDRSFLYGWLLGATVLPTGSMQGLILLHSVCGTLVALLLYAWLAWGLRIDARHALLAAGLFAIEPAQLFYERMMMAEAPGFLLFTLFFAALSLHLLRGGWQWIVLYAVLGALAVAFRISLLPVVLVLSLIAPLLRLAADDVPARPWRRRLAVAVAASALALVATLGAHQAYKHWYGRLANSEPDYTAHTGKFRLGLVAPLVEPHHFEDTGVAPTVLDQLAYDHRDPRLREAQLWVAGGLYDLLEQHSAQPSRVAGKLSIKAARENPLGLVRLGIGTTLDYFDREVFTHRLLDDLGIRPPHPEFQQVLRDHLGYDAMAVHQQPTAVYRWFALGAYWLTACLFLLAPLALVTLARGWRRPQRPLRLLLALTALGLVAGHVLFSHIVSFRYLHPLPWFVLANLALLLADWRGAQRGWRNTQ
jgi:hypothetical protein